MTGYLYEKAEDGKWKRYQSEWVTDEIKRLPKTKKYSEKTVDIEHLDALFKDLREGAMMEEKVSSVVEDVRDNTGRIDSVIVKRDDGKYLVYYLFESAFRGGVSARVTKLSNLQSLNSHYRKFDEFLDVQLHAKTQEGEKLDNEQDVIKKIVDYPSASHVTICFHNYSLTPSLAMTFGGVE